MKSVAAIALSLTVATAAFAADVRKIDFTVPVTDQDNVAITECVEPADNPCKEKRTITLGTVALRALAQPEQGLAPEESLKRGQLGLLVYRATAAQLTVEELALIKKQIAKSFSPLIVARAFAILDPAAK